MPASALDSQKCQSDHSGSACRAGLGSKEQEVSKNKFEKIPVGVLGATGMVGQKFILLLAEHPWFELTELAASERSSGNRYEDVVNWKQGAAIPEKARGMVIKPCEPNLKCRIVFSGLDASVATEVEKAFAEKGYWVFSNARNYRMEADVPLMVTEINPDHLELVRHQQRKRRWTGAIVTNPNCSATVLVLSLAPLHRRFGIEAVQVTTFQAISGAGYPGVASLDILGNVIPFISGEEEKIECETQKILGTLEGDSLTLAPFVVSAHANRVPVEEGHLECVSLRFKQRPAIEEVIECWREFKGVPQELQLPSAPLKPVIVFSERDRPQPRIDVWKYNGMSSMVGRVRACSLLHIKYVVLGHNTVRGAAGASVLNAELAVKRGVLD
ncbi:MAG: aspartate-semialdehyde dehydrogenase [Acidobacteria bacterium]|nr:aspartate-semialdehyde dehydrogenase [Acidobacteriota bacterium]